MGLKDVRSILEKRVLVFDGAMGTYYQTQPGQECEQANLTDPEGILRVHRAYLAAGAEALKTNTFGLPRMAAAGAPGWQALAEAGWRLARQAAGEKAAVFADLGPALPIWGLLPIPRASPLLRFTSGWRKYFWPRGQHVSSSRL
ncbi:hypothetical protein JCM17207_24970 [Faecalibacterium gallinarum]|uniref:Hcy-binding domain-containing protein n=1 Tax=Faecalibacterium gallinarum TaxID=2903556 RepID=A0AA37J0T1_9FIRM|nr:hypothetical protein JCM17207_24970 [Faecalibacterium gallinarum]